jgi:CDP-diacylglycerol pyrophosphatase
MRDKFRFLAQNKHRFSVPLREIKIIPLISNARNRSQLGYHISCTFFSASNFLNNLVVQDISHNAREHKWVVE